MNDPRAGLAQVRQRTDPVAAFISDYWTAASALAVIAAALGGGCIVLVNTFGVAWSAALVFFLVALVLAVIVVVLLRRDRGRARTSAPDEDRSPSTSTTASSPGPQPAPPFATPRSSPVLPHDLVDAQARIDRLQALYDEGTALKHHCLPPGTSASLALARLSRSPGLPTTGAEVRDWADLVETELRGMAKHRSVFRSEPAGPRFRTFPLDDPLLWSLDHKLGVLEDVIEELADT